MPSIPVSVLRALYEDVGRDQSRLVFEVQRGLVLYLYQKYLERIVLVLIRQ